MRFLVTMNMPSYSGNLVHQMNVEYPAKDLAHFVEVLMKEDFVIVEEFYRDPHTGGDNSRGMTAINHRYVGKIKVIPNNK
jgi:hypothetical protein